MLREEQADRELEGHQGIVAVLPELLLFQFLSGRVGTTEAPDLNQTAYCVCLHVYARQNHDAVKMNSVKANTGNALHSCGECSVVLFRLHREMHRALSLLPSFTLNS